jgi:hypothetical protein
MSCPPCPPSSSSQSFLFPLLDAALFVATSIQSYGISCSKAIVRYQIVRTACFVQVGEHFLVSTATLEGTPLAAFLEDGFAFLCILGGVKSICCLVHDGVASERAFGGIALDSPRCDGNIQLVIYLSLRCWV